MNQTRALPVLLVASLLGLVAAGRPGPAQPDTDAPTLLLATLPGPVDPKDWLCVGPFEAGSREKGIDHLLEHGGERAIRPVEGMEHLSVMALGGKVKWRKAGTEKDWVVAEYAQVDWDALVAPYGFAGIANAGYAYTTIVSPEKARALAYTEKAGLFYINGRAYAGDPYTGGFVTTPVVLEKGENRILVRLGGYGDPRFKFQLRPAANPIQIVKDDVEAPDLIAGERLRSFVGVPVANTTTNPIRNVTLSAGRDPGAAPPQAVIPYLAPLTVCKVPVGMEIDPSMLEPESAEQGTFELVIRAQAGAFEDRVRVPLAIRHPGDAVNRIFLSPVDGSAQHFSILAPRPFDPTQRYGLILSLHGAAVRSIGQVTSYAAKKDCFVAAPTNRRPYGFDWQDWGRLNALAALDHLLSDYPIDPDRVYLTGHSMGGHGTWHVGLLHPGRFAAIGPSAGWTDFHLYSPRFLRRTSLYAHPDLQRIHEMANLSDRTPLFAANARHLPVFILHGAADDNVPPTHGRRMFGILRSMGFDPVYKEVPGKGHWWDDDGKQETGVACLDDRDLMAFLTSKRRDENPREIFLRTVNPAENGKNRWIEVLSLLKPYAWADVEARMEDDRRIVLRLRNIESVRLRPPGMEGGKTAVVVNGESLPARMLDRPQVLRWTGRAYAWDEKPQQGLQKGPDLYGPIKAAYFRPFLFVYGTAGSSLDTQINLEIARNLANKWWIKGNGHVEVVPDRLVTRGQTKSLNLVLFGNEATNLLTRAIGADLPIRVSNERIRIGKQVLEGPDLAAKFVFPSPLSRDRLVLIWAGTGPEGMRLTPLQDTLFSGAGLPDYLIWDSGLRRFGWGHVAAAGFFDNRWRLSPDLGYFDPRWAEPSVP